MDQETGVQAVGGAANLITTYGAGVVALAIILVSVVFIVWKLPKIVTKLVEAQAVNNEVIRTNNDCMKEVAKASDNVSAALQLITNVFNEAIKMIKEQDIRTQSIMAEIAKISERTNACINKGDEKK